MAFSKSQKSDWLNDLVYIKKIALGGTKLTNGSAYYAIIGLRSMKIL